jgi:hypothetical protein
VSKIARVAIGAFLLQHGANPLMELQDGKPTVLHEIAHYHGQVSHILKAGVDLEMRNSQGRTPLIAACAPVGNSYR